MWVPFATVDESQSNFTVALLNRATGCPSMRSSIRAMPDASEALIAIGTAPSASIGAMSSTFGGVMSFATTTARREEMTRPSRRMASACTLCRPFDVWAVFQMVAQRRVSHDFAFTPSMEISTRTMLSPFARPTTLTFPVAGDERVMVTEMPDCADAADTLRSEPIRDAEIAQCVMRKAVTSQSGGPPSCATTSPSFGSSAIRLRCT